MRVKTIVCGLVAGALCALNASACFVTIRVACPDDKTYAGIRVWLDKVGYGYTDSLGLATFPVTQFGDYFACVDESTLPPGAKLGANCQKVKILDDATPVVTFVLTGDFCAQTPPQGPCWMTGGGTVNRPIKGQPNFSFGGVVYPGCSPNAADGGNWNVVDHATGLHFQGQSIIVDNCSGPGTLSPRVNVRIIDFHGTGRIFGIGGVEANSMPVSFIGRAIDNHDGGAGADQLFITVSDGVNTVMQIGNSVADPATIATGNIQIHTSSCDH
jgi:hypothetical protein